MRLLRHHRHRCRLHRRWKSPHHLPLPRRLHLRRLRHRRSPLRPPLLPRLRLPPLHLPRSPRCHSQLPSRPNQPDNSNYCYPRHIPDSKLALVSWASFRPWCFGFEPSSLLDWLFCLSLTFSSFFSLMFYSTRLGHHFKIEKIQIYKQLKPAFFVMQHLRWWKQRRNYNRLEFFILI